MGADRQIAAPAELGEEGPLQRRRGRGRRARRSRPAAPGSVIVAAAALDGHGALADLRHHVLDGSSTSATRSVEAETVRGRPRPSRSRRRRAPCRGGCRCCRAARRTRGRGGARRAGPGAAPSRWRRWRRARGRRGGSRRARRAGRPAAARRPSTRPSGVGPDGRSLAECTATSARPSSTACWTSFTNTPWPPIACSGTSVRTSPVVSTTHQLDADAGIGGPQSRSATCLGLPLRQRGCRGWRGAVARPHARSNRSRTAAALRSPRGVPASSLQAHRRLVQQLGDDAAGERLDGVALGARRGRRACRRSGASSAWRTASACSCSWATSGAACAGGDAPRRNGSTSSATIVPHLAGLGGALGDAAGGPVAQVVEVEQGDAGELGDGGVDVAGHGDVDDEQRAAGAWPRSTDVGARSTTDAGAGGREQHVGVGERARPARRTARPGPPTRSASSTARSCVRLATTISPTPGAGQRDGRCPRPSRRRRRRAPCAPASEPRRSVAISTAAWRHRRRRPADAGLGAGPLADLEGVAEQQVQRGAGARPRAWAISHALRTWPRISRLAEHGRVEPGRDLEQVGDGGVVVLAVEVGLQVLGREAGRRSQKKSRMSA